MTPGGPGQGGYGSYGQQPGQGTGDQVVQYVENEISYYYRVNDVVIIITVAADQKIAEIGIYAMNADAQRRSSYKTSKGIGTNSTYVDVLRKYGFPNEHRTMGGGLTLVTYTDTNNVSFLLDERYHVVALVIGTNDLYQKAMTQGIK